MAEIQTAVGKLDDRLEFLSPRSAGSVGAGHILRYMEEFGYVTQFSKDDYTAVIKGKLQH